MNRKTEPLYLIGIGSLLIVAAIYALAIMFGVGAAIIQVASETGLPALVFMVVPGLVLFGLGCLLLKVLIDQLGNEEDQHYSRTVDK